MNRRATLAATIFWALLALGCGKSEQGAGSAASKSKNKDTYVHVTFSDTDSLDPAWSYDTQSHSIIAGIYEYLFDYKGESITELVPRTAAKVPSKANGLISADGLVYRIPIRKGVPFHKGGELTPEDARYSLMRFMLHDRVSGPSSLVLEPLTGLASTRDDTGEIIKDAYEKVAKSVQVEGDAIVLRLHKPFSPILTVLASWAPMLDKEWVIANGGWDGTGATWEKYNNPDKNASYLHDNSNGTGPFMLERWEKKTKEVILARFDSYWRGKAKLKRYVLKGVDEFQTRKLMLAAGDADSIYADYLQLPLLQNMEGVEIIDDLPRISMDPAIFFVFDIKTKGNPNVGSGALDGKGVPANFFADINVRKAFAHALDYEGYIREVNRGKGSRANGFIPKGLFGHNPNQKVYDYDLEKSERYFRKAHGGKVWSRGFKFTLSYNAGNQPREVIANMIKRAVESLNPKFRIDTRPIQWSTYLDQSHSSKLPMFIVGWHPDYPDPHNFAFPYLHSKGTYPQAQRYNNPEVDRLVRQAMTETDTAKRKSLYYQLQEIAYQEVPTLFIINTVRFRTQRTWVKGFVYNPIYPDSPYQAPLFELEKE